LLVGIEKTFNLVRHLVEIIIVPAVGDVFKFPKNEAVAHHTNTCPERSTNQPGSEVTQEPLDTTSRLRTPPPHACSRCISIKLSEPVEQLDFSALQHLKPANEVHTLSNGPAET
jgi:hypothetical protein